VEISAWLASLEATSVASSIRDSLYSFPLLESVHVMALSVVFGTIMVVDLRLLGFASSHRPFTRMSKELLSITWGAFIVAALTGALMFVTNARVYAGNTSFRVKMVLLVLAGINMAVFHLTAGRRVNVARWDKAPAAPGIGKITATLSLSLWIAIIFAGRVIGFTTRGAQAKEETPVAAQNFDDFLGGDAPAAGAAAGAVTAAGPTEPRDPAATYSIRTIMASMVDPSGDFLFESVADIADDKGVTHRGPKTPQEWEAVRHHLQVLVDSAKLLSEPGRKAAEPGDKSANPAVENEPAEVQKLIDGQHADFVTRAARLAAAAKVGLKAVDAQDTAALFKAITGIDKACESCHLHYWYPKDQRAHQAAREEGGVIE
jgi:cytochrome c556